MKNKLAIPILGLVLCILGLTIQLLGSEAEIIPQGLKGKGTWIVIIGLLITSINLIVTGSKKKK